MIQFEPLGPSDCILAEGLSISKDGHVVSWVDIQSNRVFVKDTNSEKVHTYTNWNFPSCTFQSELDWIYVAHDAGIDKFNLNSMEFQNCISWFQPGDDLRCNDGKLDSDGNIWISVMSKSMEVGKASIWKWDRRNNPIRIKENLTIPNSICIDKKLNRFYYTDTPSNKIFVGDLRSIESAKSIESVFFDGELTPGVPDGSCLDSEGFMWNTRWDGGKIIKISPNGALVGELELPFSKPTSVEINLRGDMYFTTATSSNSENNGGAYIVRKIIQMV